MSDLKNPEQKPLLPLGSNRSDRLTALIRSIGGAIPFVGAALGEIITMIVPNQRIERLEKYLLYLQEEIVRLRIDADDERIKRPENVGLIEDGAYQAVRTLSDERKRYIARCVARGIASDVRVHAHETRILDLLGQLDEEELLILDAFGSSGSEMREKFDRLKPKHPNIGVTIEQEREKTVYDAAFRKLERLYLIQQKIVLDTKAQRFGMTLPTFDAFGQQRGDYAITPLGALLLEKIKS